MKLCMQVGPAPSNFVLDGDPSPMGRGGAQNATVRSVIFATAKLLFVIYLIILTDRYRSSLSHGKAVRPSSVARTRCGRMAGWIEMKLVMQVGLAPSNFVLDGALSPGEGG